MAGGESCGGERFVHAIGGGGGADAGAGGIEEEQGGMNQLEHSEPNHS